MADEYQLENWDFDVVIIVCYRPRQWKYVESATILSTDRRIPNFEGLFSYLNKMDNNTLSLLYNFVYYSLYLATKTTGFLQQCFKDILGIVTYCFIRVSQATLASCTLKTSRISGFYIGDSN